MRWLGSPLPTRGLSARCAPRLQDLAYTVNSNSKRGQKVALLKGISGYFEPAEMTAVVSGCEPCPSELYPSPHHVQSLAQFRLVLASSSVLTRCPSPVLVQMGPSGSGKTTFLDLLSGRKTQVGRRGRRGSRTESLRRPLAAMQRPGRSHPTCERTLCVPPAAGRHTWGHDSHGP
jgi:hypothetical protein